MQGRSGAFGLEGNYLGGEDFDFREGGFAEGFGHFSARKDSLRSHCFEEFTGHFPDFETQMEEEALCHFQSGFGLEDSGCEKGGLEAAWMTQETSCSFPGDPSPSKVPKSEAMDLESEDCPPASSDPLGKKSARSAPLRARKRPEQTSDDSEAGDWAAQDRLEAKVYKTRLFWSGETLFIPNVFRQLRTEDDDSQCLLEQQDLSHKPLLVQGAVGRPRDPRRLSLSDSCSLKTDPTAQNFSD